MYEILFVVGGFLLLIIALLVIFGIFSTLKHTPLSDYDLYGPDGADEWERRQMGLSKKEYEDKVLKNIKE